MLHPNSVSQVTKQLLVTTLGARLQPGTSDFDLDREKEDLKIAYFGQCPDGADIDRLTDLVQSTVDAGTGMALGLIAQGFDADVILARIKNLLASALGDIDDTDFLSRRVYNLAELQFSPETA